MVNDSPGAQLLAELVVDVGGPEQQQATESSPTRTLSTSHRQAPLCSICQAKARPVTALDSAAVGRTRAVDQVDVPTASKAPRPG